MVQEAAIADLRKHGFELISVAEPDLMANDPTRVLMRQLLGAVAQYDKAHIVAKLRGARMRKRAKEGRCEGRKPYGHLDGEDAVINRMLELRNPALASTRSLQRSITRASGPGPARSGTDPPSTAFSRARNKLNQGDAGDRKQRHASQRDVDSTERVRNEIQAPVVEASAPAAFHALPPRGGRTYGSEALQGTLRELP
jgi:hypothetical protein